ncbi:putative portal protein [Pseudomonas phage ventosus]|uniref:Putative portal protein n=1 Tax=Pseudomonas phage ventosus TaxID=2048980 RepID=A0A2H4P7T5_9CAUD|nr:putative portal protein [Pseudomonas phage ventosus]
MTEAIEKASIPRLRLGEIGVVGLKQHGGRIQEEARKELRFPEANRTFRTMAQDATIASALSLFEMMVSRVEWIVDTGIDPTPEMKANAQFLEEVMHDMEHSWRSFIQEVTSAFTYGYCINEKVYRRRTWDNGSQYNDNKVGFRKLPVRSQDTIYKWLYSDDGRDLIGVQQNLATITDGTDRYARLLNATGTVDIPRKKFLHFRVDAKRDNPEGNSPLRAAYHAWKYRTVIEEQEAVGVTRDMNGMPTLYLPPRYMSQDATDSEKAIYEYYKNVIRNIQMNEQSGLILPQAFDPDSRQPLFKFELTSTMGGKMYDTDAIIKRWDNKILMVLFADMLKMGQDQVGSYSLAGAKTNIMAMAIEARLQEIQDVLNNDLVKQLFAMNGVPPNVKLPKLVYGDLDEVDLDEFSKAIQRIGSVGGLERDRPVMNKIREALKIVKRPDDAPVKEDEIMGGQSQAGQAGVGNGASKTASGRDNSAANNA